MRHRVAGRKLQRTSSHRAALFRNMAAAVIKHEPITTTTAGVGDSQRAAGELARMSSELQQLVGSFRV